MKGVPLKDVIRHVIAGLRENTVGKLAAAQMLESAMPPEVKDLPNALGIQMYLHCKKCLVERPESTSPQDWRRLDVGFTKEGLQVWCTRHDVNVAHIHFEGMQHPANLTAAKK
jgi:hypothetical protein